MKRILTGLFALTFAAQVSAAELMTTPSGPATELTKETGWTVGAGNRLTATSVYGKRAYKLASVIAGRTYKYTITMTRTAGAAQVYVSGVKMGSTGGYITSPTTGGTTGIADNFTTANGLITGVALEDKEFDANGSFRLVCKAGQAYPDDPLLNAGAPGSSHLHQFWGNTGANAYSTYRSLRTTGGSTCSDPKYPVNRTGYWTPAMLDGMGNIVPFSISLEYYKMIPAGLPECQGAPDATHVGYCVGLPNGIRFIKGFNATTMTGSPDRVGTPEQQSFYYECHDTRGVNNATAPGRYISIDAVVAAGCPSGALLFVSMIGPGCWDGVNLDTPNHRDHIAYTESQITLAPNALLVGSGGTPLTLAQRSWGKCPVTHPYAIVPYSSLRWYRTDANFVAGRWRLSSDEQMGMSMPAGATLHFDYYEAWSPAVKALWIANCINQKNSSNGGELCEGSQIKGALGVGAAAQSPFRPRSRYGWSRPLTASGTYTGEFKAVSGGELGAYGYGGFTGEITSLSIVDVTAINKAAVTQTITK